MQDLTEFFIDETTLTAKEKVLLIFLATTFFGAMVWLLKHYWDHLINHFIVNRKKFYKNIYPKKANKDDYQKLLENYINSKWQDQNPDIYDQLSNNQQYPVASRNLIEDFLCFFEDKDAKKRHLILGGTGMGKSTFMLKLYLKYYLKYFKKYQIQLIQVQLCNDSQELEEIINSIPNQQNSILLIDGLDEDPKSIEFSKFTEYKNVKNRLQRIVELSNAFHFLVITARTQLFPTQSSSQPYLKITTGITKKPIILNRYYLSPFTKNDVHNYISKRYSSLPFISKDYYKNKAKQKKAMEMIEKFNDIFFRPLIISYLHELIEEGHLFEIDVYKSIIKRWIYDREYKRSDRNNSSGKFLAQLEEFSSLASIAIYKFRDKRTKLEEKNTITLEELNKVYKTLENSSDSGLNATKEEVRVQSLITRVNDYFKMVHKSFLEYFLAINCFKDPFFAKEFDFKRYPESHKFFNEMLLKDFLENQLAIDLKTKYLALSDMNKVDLHNSVLKVKGRQKNLSRQPLADYDFRNLL